MNLTSVILRTFSSYAENVFILYNVNKHVDILYVTSLVHVETSHFGNHSNNFKFKRKGACSRFTLFIETRCFVTIRSRNRQKVKVC